MAHVNPVTGPVFVKGAQPGDVLAVEILEFVPQDWGWTAIIPGFGLLADEFPDPWLNISTGRPPSQDGRSSSTASPSPSRRSRARSGWPPPSRASTRSSPRRKWGGNMDIKHLRAGTTLYLPVAVEGALFSVGDTHAAMGDAEVCGTAVETAMDITVRLSVRKDMTTTYPQYSIPEGQLAETETSGYHVCTGDRARPVRGRPGGDPRARRPHRAAVRTQPPGGVRDRVGRRRPADPRDRRRAQLGRRGVPARGDLHRRLTATAEKPQYAIGRTSA